MRSLLPPYDFLYYSGVRAYYGEEWTRAAELLEKSIATKETLISVRKKCHDECVAAGKEALDKLGEWSRACTVKPYPSCRCLDIAIGTVRKVQNVEWIFSL